MGRRLAVVSLAVVLALSCDWGEPPLIGALRVSVTTAGGDFDLDGYALSLPGLPARTINLNQIVLVPELAPGIYEVTLGDVAANCSVEGENVRTVGIAAGDTTPAVFAVTCIVTGVEVTAATTGLDLDPNGYAVSVDGATPVTLPVNGAVSITRLPAGTHTVELMGAVANCVQGGANPQSVNVPLGEVVVVVFPVTCRATSGVIEVATATSGVDFDPDGYTVQLDSGTSRAIGVNGVLRISGASGGDHTVTLAGTRFNCAAADPNPRSVTVTTGGTARDTVRTAFVVTCEAATGAARVITATTGTDLDPDGYLLGVDCYEDYYYRYCGHEEPMAANDTVFLASYQAGSHTFELQSVAPNCDVSGNNQRSVQVAGGGVTDVVFTVACAAFGSLQVTTMTTGVDLDPNGYSITAAGPRFSLTRDLAANETATISGLLAGSYSVTLNGMAQNCDLAGLNPVTVTVPSGGTATVPIEAVCVAARELAVAQVVGGNWDIYRVKSNGTGLTRLTSDAAYEDWPAWSPDGSKIAFVSTREGNHDIYVMNANGSGQTRLTNHSSLDYRPAWSPDGTKIAFVSDRDGNPEIYVMNSDGTGVARLTNHGAADGDPAWSPDGTRIAFWSGRAGDPAIHVMNSDGSGVTRLATSSEWPRPTWSPDGTKIAFSGVTVCDYYYCKRDLSVVNANGSGVTQLTSGPDDNGDPAWSPDGQWIAFNTAPCDYYYGCSEWRIRAVRSDGTDVRDVIGPSALFPAWRP